MLGLGLATRVIGVTEELTQFLVICRGSNCITVIIIDDDGVFTQSGVDKERSFNSLEGNFGLG